MWINAGVKMDSQRKIQLGNLAFNLSDIISTHKKNLLQSTLTYKIY